MKIAVVGPAALDDMADSIARAFRRMGHEAVLVGPAAWEPPLGGRRLRALSDVLSRDPRVGPWVSEHLYRRVMATQCELMVTVQALRPEIVRTLNAAGIATAMWFPDAVTNLGPMWMFESPYTGIFLKDPLIVDRLNAMVDLPVHYLPEACDPALHFPIDGARIRSVAVVGNVYPTRARLLEKLIADHVPLALYGGSYLARLPTAVRNCHTGRYLRAREKSYVFRNSSAVLNNLHPAELTSMNARLFESTAAGGLVITEERQSLGALFEHDREVLAFTNYRELMSSLDRALSDASLRDRLGDAASIRAHSEHTYDLRLARLLAVVGKAPPPQ